MEICEESYANWEKGKTEPVASQFRPVVTFIGTTQRQRPGPRRPAPSPSPACRGGHLYGVSAHRLIDILDAVMNENMRCSMRFHLLVPGG
jgi:hypothetical protein